MASPAKSMRTTILPFAPLGLIVCVAGCSSEVSTADPISSSCSGSDLHVSPADLAKTPRPDAVAEGLAIEASGALFAPDDVYERIHRDLANIRASHPEIADIGHLPSITGDGLIVMFDDAGIAAVKAKTYKDWDYLNTLLGFNVQEIFTLIPAAVLRSNELYNLQVLAKEYKALPHVTSAEPDSVIGDSSDTCAAIDGSTYEYVFDAAAGDCPAGCIDHTYHGFSTTPDGAITPLGTFTLGSGATPAWLTSLSACTKWL